MSKGAATFQVEIYWRDGIEIVRGYERRCIDLRADAIGRGIAVSGVYKVRPSYYVEIKTGKGWEVQRERMTRTEALKLWAEIESEMEYETRISVEFVPEKSLG